MLWFGWYGFNPGSTLSAMDFEGIGRVAANTTLAACSAGFAAMFVAYFMSKKWDMSFTVNGFLAGLVAITCPCYWVSPTGAILLGAVAGVIVVYGVELLEYLRIDDPIGAVPVHGMCGIWGTCRWVCSLPASSAQPGRSRRTTRLLSKACSTAAARKCWWRRSSAARIITVSTFVVALVVMYVDQCHGPPAHLGRRRKLRSGSPRAWHLGLPRVCHLLDGTAGWHGHRIRRSSDLRPIGELPG